MTLSPAVQEKLAQLGLQNEPFAPVKVNVFDKRAYAEPVPVDGFSTLNEVETYLRTAREENTTPFLAIVGQTGTGRSLAAKHVLNLWRTIRGLSPERYVIPAIARLHFGDHDIFKRWMGFLRQLAWELNIPIPEAADTALEQAIANSDPSTYPTTFRRHAIAYANYMHAADASYALCLEEIPAEIYLDSAKITFETAGVICVCTIKDNAEIDPGAFGWNTLRLSPLTGDEVTNFVSSFWHKCANSDLPFDVEVLRAAFNGRSDTIAKVRTLMSRVLINKLEAPPEEAWSFADALARAESGS